MEDGKIVIKAQIDDSGLDSGLKEVESKVGKSANSVMNIVKGLSLHDVINKAMGTAIKFANDVNQATESISAKLKGASTLYQGVAVDQNQLLQNLGAIASKTGADLETLGQSVYDALSAGVKPTEDMADVLKVVEASAKLAAGGFTNTSTALSSTMKVLNAYSMDLKELDKVQGILMQTQNSGITTVDELGASLAQVVPTAASFGVSFENVGAAIAEMTKQGTKTAQATTALNAIIAELGKNGTNASKNLKAAAEASGMSATSFTEMLNSGMNLAEILEVMSDYAEENGLSMVDMFSSIEAGKGALQLTGQAGDDFNEIMDSMSESAGLVQEAFEKTVDPSQKLSAAWNNLLVTLGTKFKPAADGVRESLATMLDKLSGQYTIADKLDDTYGDLETALKNYKKASEEAAGKTDALTLSMVAQRKAELQTALWKSSEAYVEASRSIDIYTKKQEDAEKQYNATTSAIEKYTKKTGKSVDWLMENMYDSEELFKVFYEGYGDSYESFMNQFLTQANKRIDAQKDMIEYSTKLSQSEVYEAQFIDNLTKGYIDENEATMMLLKTYPELEQKVLDNVEAYKALEEAKEGAEGAGSGSGGNGGGSPSPAVDDAGYTYDDFSKELDEVIAQYEKLDRAAFATGEQLYDQSEKADALTSIYIKAVKNGISPVSQGMRNLWDMIKELNPAIEEQATKEELLSDELDSVVEKYQNLSAAGELLGEQLYDNDKFVGELTSLYKKYVEAGVDPASDAMQELTSWIEAFGNATGKANDDLTEFEKGFKNFVKSASTSIAQGLGQGFEDMIVSLETQDERLKEIDKQINEIGDESAGKLKEAIDAVTLAQTELNIATQRGDTVAIANATKKKEAAEHLRDTLKETSTQLGKQRKEVETGADSWKLFGRSALESLASVIEGLAGQLAAMAISTYPNFGQMAASAAGAAIAYTAAGVIRAKAQKFATGGIVQGNSYTGDNIPVRVNAGELILNMAQQETLARMLEASVALAEINASGGSGGGITINMEGATIYGLDEPAVGKAIYENIEQLKYEGVI